MTKTSSIKYVNHIEMWKVWETTFECREKSMERLVATTCQQYLKGIHKDVIN
jgi:hypothetical protein